MSTEGRVWATQDLITADRMNQKTNLVSDTEPTTTFAGMHWYDTSSNTEKVRNGDNTAWFICVNQSLQTTDTPTFAGAVLSGTIRINGNGIYNSRYKQIIQCNATDWLRINQDTSYTSGVAAYGTWNFGGRVRIGDWGTSTNALEVVGNIVSTGTIYAPSFENFIQNGSLTNKVLGVGLTALIDNPKSGFVWHDLFAFCVTDTPVFETTVDGSTWVAGTLNKNLFSQRQNQSITVIDNPSQVGCRWSWDYTGFAWSTGRWLLIAFTYVPNAPTVTITFESSSDGTNWTQQHTSSGTYSSSPYWFYIGDYAGRYFLRLTMIQTAGADDVKLSSIKLLGYRWGDQGLGSEYEFPYSWDADRNITVPSNLSVSSGNIQFRSDDYASAFWIRHDGSHALISTKVGNLYFGLNGTTGLEQNFYAAVYNWRNQAATNIMSLDTDGNLTVGGTVDGVDISALLIKSTKVTDLATIWDKTTKIAYADTTITKTDLGLDSVENTALSTWNGSTNLTTVGVITAGTWQSVTKIAGTYLNLNTTAGTKTTDLSKLWDKTTKIAFTDIVTGATPTSWTIVWSQITSGVPAFLTTVTPANLSGSGAINASWTMPYSQLTSVPSSFTPSAHTHVKTDITDFTHTHLWADLTDKPTTFTPSTHTHPSSAITDWGTYINQALLTSSSPTFVTPTVTSLKIIDASTAFDLILASDSTTAFTADRILTIDLDNAARTVALKGNLTVETASIVNQDLTTDASPTWAGATINGNITCSGSVDGVDISGLLIKTTKVTDLATIWDKTTKIAIGDTSISWSNLPNIPASFTPSSHTHPSSQITDWSTYINQALLTSSSPTFATPTVTSLKVIDATTSFDLILASDSATAFTADRTLTINLNDAARTLALLGNLTVESASTINQDLTTDASPTFSGGTFNGNIVCSGTVDGVDLSALLIKAVKVTDLGAIWDKTTKIALADTSLTKANITSLLTVDPSTFLIQASKVADLGTIWTKGTKIAFSDIAIGATPTSWTIAWSQIASGVPAYLTTVTPSNLSGTGAIASGWTLAWNQLTSTPSTFTPSVHTHSSSDISNWAANMLLSSSYKIEWSDDSSGYDTFLYRYMPNYLKTDGKFCAVGNIFSLSDGISLLSSTVAYFIAQTTSDDSLGYRLTRNVTSGTHNITWTNYLPASSKMLTWQADTTTVMSLDAAGNLAVTGNIITTGTVDGVNISALLLKTAKITDLATIWDKTTKIAYADTTITKADLGLGNVENIPISTVTDQSVSSTSSPTFYNIIINAGGLVDGVDISELLIKTTKVTNLATIWDKTTKISFADTTITKTDLGLGSVENTALSTWAGTSNITTLGTITTGVWSGSQIAASKVDLSGVVPTSRTVNGHALSANVTVTKSDVGLANVENTALSAYINQAVKTTSSPTFSNVSLGGFSVLNQGFFSDSTFGAVICGVNTASRAIFGMNFYADFYNNHITKAAGTVGYAGMSVTPSIIDWYAEVVTTTLGGTVYPTSKMSLTKDGDLTVYRNIITSGTVDGVDLSALLLKTTKVDDLATIWSKSTKIAYADTTITKADLGLGSVENITLSTFIDQEVKSTSSPTFYNITISSGGTVDGVDISGLLIKTTKVTDLATIWTKATKIAFADTSITKTDLGIGSVENTAISTWAGSANITTLGTISTGVWNGTTIAASKVDLTGVVPTSRTVNSKALTANISITASDVGLGSVENTALSTWTGSSNITTVGTLASLTVSTTLIIPVLASDPASPAVGQIWLVTT